MNRRVNSTLQRQIGHVDFHYALQQVSSGAHHRPSKAVQHRPCGLITVQTEHSLQPQRADALLLARQVPCSGKPHAKRCARLVENGSCGDAALVTAGSADQPTPRGAPWGICHPASRAAESALPPQLFQICRTCFIGGKPVLKFTQIARIGSPALCVPPGAWRRPSLSMYRAPRAARPVR